MANSTLVSVGTLQKTGTSDLARTFSFDTTSAFESDSPLADRDRARDAVLFGPEGIDADKLGVTV